jgi:hypothetical protein
MLTTVMRISDQEFRLSSLYLEYLTVSITDKLLLGWVSATKDSGTAPYLEYLTVSIADKLLLRWAGLVHAERDAVHQDHRHRQPLEPAAIINTLHMRFSV